ncbi:glycosyltransferase family 32 protein, partial [Atractiella rhizophila]
MGLFLPPTITITSPDLKSSSLPSLVVRRPRSRLFSLLALSLLVFLYTHTSLIPRFTTGSSPSAVSAVPSPIPSSSSLSDHDPLPPFEVPVPPKQKDRKVELTPLGERAERSYAHVGPEGWEDYVHQLLGFVRANLPSVESETRRWLSYGTSSPPQDEGNMRIPLSLWQTSKSYSKSLKFGSLHLGSWRKKHGDALNQTFYNDDGITKSSLVNASPLIRETVTNLSSIHIQMSDFWRYLILAREGGIYSDADTRCLKEAWKWSWIGGSLEADFVRERESRWAHFLRMLGRPGSEASPWAVEESSRESEEGAGERKVVSFEKAGKKGWWHRLFGGDEDGKKKGKDGMGWVKDQQRGIWYEEQFQDGVGLIVGIEADVGDRTDWYD